MKMLRFSHMDWRLLFRHERDDPSPGLCDSSIHREASLMAQLVKNLPAMWETWVQSLGWEDPLEKGTGREHVLGR